MKGGGAPPCGNGRDEGRREPSKHQVVLELGDQALVGWIPSVLMNETVKVGRNFKGPQAQPQREHQPDRRSATVDASMLRFAEKLHAIA